MVILEVGRVDWPSFCFMCCFMFRRGTGKGNVSRSCPFFFFQSPHHCQQCEERIYPIHVAAQLGDLKIVKMLLEDGADPLQVRHFGILR